MDPEKLYDKGYTWLLTIGPKILLAIVVLLVGLWLIKLARKWLIAGMVRREFDPSLQPFLQSLIIISLQVMLVLAIMQILGIELTIFTAVIGAFGVAAGLALSGTLQNFASGVLILLLKPFRVGDNIVAQGQEGTVESIQIFYTVVTTYDNKTVIIPNSKLSNEVIINISLQGKRRLDIQLKFSYAEDIEYIKSTIYDYLRSEPAILKDPPPSIGVFSLEPDGYKLVLNIWISAKTYQTAKLTIQERLLKTLKNSTLKLPGT